MQGESEGKMSRRLLLTRDFNPAATQIQELSGSAFHGLQHGFAQLVIDEPSLTPRSDEISMLQDLQMVRNQNDFDTEKLRDVADRHFSLTQQIDNPQSQRLRQRLQQGGTVIGLKTVGRRRITHGR